MKRPDTELIRARRIAWGRAFGRPLSEDERRLLSDLAAREEGALGSVERVVSAVRRVTHGDPRVATGAERRALFEEIMARREGRPRKAGGALRVLGWAGAAAAAALALILLVPRDAPVRRGPREHLAVRGAEDSLPAAGLGISGVDSAGSEYEVIHGEGLCSEDALRFYLTLRDGRTPHYALFGVQDPEDPSWYVPEMHDAAGPSLPEVPVRTWMVPFEIVADGTHDSGPVSVVCILSEEPITFSRLEAAWGDAAGRDVTSRAEDTAAALTDGVVRVLVEEIEILDDCGRRP